MFYFFYSTMVRNGNLAEPRLSKMGSTVCNGTWTLNRDKETFTEAEESDKV